MYNSIIHWVYLLILVDLCLYLILAISASKSLIRNGKFITTWESRGSGNGQFEYPHGISLDSFKNVYVVDTGNQRIQKFDLNGTFITTWGTLGTGKGQFNNPQCISVDSFDNMYVARYWQSAHPKV